MTLGPQSRVSQYSLGDGPSPARRRPRWLVPLLVGLGVLFLLVLPAIGSYNKLVDQEARVDQKFADLDAALQRRYDLIPQLVGAVRGALQQEQAVFGEIARARQNYAGARTPAQKAEASGQVESALARLLVIVEQYPQLRSIETITNLQVQIEGSENRINQQRLDYNEVVTDYNRAIRRFPRSLFAGVFGFERKPLFTAAAGAGDAPTVDLNTSPTPAG